MENQIFELQYAMDTFYFLVCGALVMWMAAGFAMLEAGLVRSKNTTEILTKNVALFAVSCIMYLICGYAIMYGGGIFLDGIEGGESLVADALAALHGKIVSRAAGPLDLADRPLADWQARKFSTTVDDARGMLGEFVTALGIRETLTVEALAGGSLLVRGGA